jgi:NAD(P)H dehydrogenase (quinone)
MIALIGATGTIGRHVAASLASSGVPARVLVRDPGRADVPIPTVAADLRDPASLRKAFTGSEQVFLLTPHDPEQDLLEAGAIDAAVAAGVRRVVKISGGAGTLGPNGVTSTAVAHWRSERRIEESGLGFTFLRPSFLMQNLLNTAAPTVSRLGLLVAPMGRAPVAMVDARDVADSAVAALVAESSADWAWQLTGRAVSFPDIAARLGVPYVNLPFRLAAAVLRRRGAAPFEVEHSLRMAAYYASGADRTATDSVYNLTGRPPRTIDDFLAEHAEAFGGRRLRLAPRAPSSTRYLRPT